MENFNHFELSKVSEAINKLEDEKDKLIEQNTDLKNEVEFLKLQLKQLSNSKKINDDLNSEESYYYQSSDIDELLNIKFNNSFNFSIQELTDSIPQLVWLSRPDGYVDFYSQTFREYVGLTSEQIKGLGWESFLHPDDLPLTLEKWHHSLETGEALEIESRMKKQKDNSYRYHLIKVLPVHNNIGQIIKWFGTNTDIHDKKEIEQQLKKSEQRFRFLVELSSQIVWTTDIDGKLIEDCEGWRYFTGQTKEEISGFGWLDAIHPDDRKNAYKIWSKSIKNKTVFEMELRLKKYNGLYADVIDKGVPIIDSEGNINEWVGTITDISEEKIAEQKQKFLLEATLLLNSSLDYQNTLKSLISVAVPYFSDYAYIDITDQKSVLNRITPDIAKEGSENIYNIIAIPITEEPALISELSEADLKTISISENDYFTLKSLDLKSCIIVPLICQSRTIGTINFITSQKSGRMYSDNDLILAQELSSRISLSLDNSYFFELARHEKLKAEHKAIEFEFLANAIPQLIWTANPDGKVIYYNKGWSDYTGLDIENLLETGWQALAHPDDPGLGIKKWQEALQSNKDFEVEIRLKNIIKNEYHWFLGRAKPLIDEQGKVIKWFGTFTDIDYKKRIEEERRQLLINEQLARNEADFERFKLNSLFMNAPAAICVYYGPEHIYELVNPAYKELLGKNNVIGRTIREALPERENQNFLELLDNVFITGKQFINPEMMIMLDRDGLGELEETFFNIVFQPIKSINGETERIAVFGFDITEQIKARKNSEILTMQLANSNKDLQQFAYVASHDLQEPLRTITNYIKLLQKKMKDKLNQEELELFDFVTDGSLRMKSLISDILNYSKISNKSKEFKLTDLNFILKNIINDFKGLIELNNASIIFEELPCLNVEPTLISQLFQNLISNAIKYKGKENPVVKIKADYHNYEWIFSISDNGIGIQEEYFERIFQIFQRLHSRTEYEGTGIGLAICKKIVDLHNGKIWLKSEEGEGTTFYFSLSE